MPRLDRLRARPPATDDATDGDDTVRPVAQPRAASRERRARRGSGRATSPSRARRQPSCSSNGAGLPSGPTRSRCSASERRVGREPSTSRCSGFAASRIQHDAVREFGGDHRFVADYLNHEILSSLDEASRWFLLRTSVLRHFTVELCDIVFGRSDAASRSKRWSTRTSSSLAWSTAGWFRVHPLFAEFAEFQLEAHDAGASRWRSIGVLLSGFSNEGFYPRRSSTLRLHMTTSSSPASPPTTTCR